MRAAAIRSWTAAVQSLKARPLPAIFALLALPVCFALAPLVPPAESPDENVHVLRAESLLYGDLTGIRTAIPMPDGPHLEALLHGDPGLTRMMTIFRELPADARTMSAELRARMRTVRWSAAPDLYSAQTAGYPPVFYLPVSFGLLAARATRMIPYDALIVARICNALATVVGGAIALGLARRGRLLLFAMLALPMSLWLAATVHPDAPMLAALAIVVALVSRWCVSKEPPRASLWIAAILIGCVIALKPPFAPMAGVLLLPLRSRVRRSRYESIRRAGAVIVALAIGLGWAAFGQLRAGIPLARDVPYVAGPLYPGPPETIFRTTDARAQIRVLLAAPMRVLTLPLGTMEAEAAEKMREAIGVLGQLDLPLPGWLYWAWTAALGAALLGDMMAVRGRDGPSVPDKLLVMAIGTASVLATYLTLYVTWTPVGAERIEGFQGRYLLPLLALVGLALPRIEVTGERIWTACCGALIAAALLMNACVLPALTVFEYYGL